MTDARAPDGETPLPWRRRRPRPAAATARTPAVRRLAAEQGVDAGAITGTGTGGRVTKADVLAAGAPAPAPATAPAVGAAATGSDVVPFNRLRVRAAAALLQSKSTAAHSLTVTAADYSALDAARRAARERFRADEGFALTYLPFVARAVVDALRDYPLLNATGNDDGPVLHRDVHLGIAVDLDHEGLVVPVVRRASELRLRAVARSIHDLATRARARRLEPDDVAGVTFTITNPGGYGTWVSVPVIHQPAVAILSTDGVAKRAVAVGRDGGTATLAVRPVGHLCLSFDHRFVAPPYAAAFLARVRALVEHRDWAAEL